MDDKNSKMDNFKLEALFTQVTSRLERLDSKVDKISDIVVQLARNEESVKHLQKGHDDLVVRLQNVEAAVVSSKANYKWNDWSTKLIAGSLLTGSVGLLFFIVQSMI